MIIIYRCNMLIYFFHAACVVNKIKYLFCQFPFDIAVCMVGHTVLPTQSYMYYIHKCYRYTIHFVTTPMGLHPVGYLGKHRYMAQSHITRGLVFRGTNKHSLCVALTRGQSSLVRCGHVNNSKNNKAFTHCVLP